MPTERRRDAATAGTGAAMLAGGGYLRHRGVLAAHPDVTKQPKIHAAAMARAPKGKKLFWGGTALGLVGVAPLGLGASRLVRPVEKAAKPPGGLGGAAGGLGGFGGWRKLQRLDPARAKKKSPMHGLSAGSALSAAYPKGVVRRAPEVVVENRPLTRREEAMADWSARTKAKHREAMRRRREGLPVSEPKREKVFWSDPRRRGGRVEKRDDKRPLWREGLSGTAESLQGRKESLTTKQPGSVRATSLGVAAGAGGLGSVLTRAALGRRGDALKPFASPVAGGLAATASIPITNKLIRRKHPEYVATATGVKRVKTQPKRPSSAAHMVSTRHGPIRGQLVPHDERFAKAAPRAAGALQRGGRALSLAGLQRAMGGAGSYATFREVPRARYLKDGRVVGRHKKPSALSALHDAAVSSRQPFGVSKPRDMVETALMLKTGNSLERAGRRLEQAKPLRLRPVNKSDNRYLGARTGYGAQRAAVTAAGHPPIVGPLTSAAMAGKYAPPGQERKHATRQWAMGSGAGVVTGTAGAYAGAKWAANSDKALSASTKLLDTKDRVEGKVRRAVRLPEKKPNPTGWKARQVGRFTSSRLGKPFATPRGAIGGAAGFLGVKAATGAVGGQAAITLNQRDQTRYNRKHGISKGQSKREKHELARKKRTSAVLSAVGGTAGLTGVGLLVAGKKSAATSAGIVGGGFGGANALLNTPIQRKEAQAIDPGKVRKADALEIRYPKEHKALLAAYGDRGPLPKGLDRETKMKAYEARYVRHGGHKANKWARRGESADKIKNTGLGVATLGGAGWLATRTKAGHKVASRINPRTRHHADTIAVAGGVLGGAGEMARGYANHKQSSYSNSPGGVAASSLRRMRAYTPEDQ